MRFSFTLLIILFVQHFAIAQVGLKTMLDHLNNDPFDADGQIKGIGIVEVDLGQQYYGKDLLIYDANGNPKISVTVTQNDVATKIGQKSYSRNDNSNPFNPRFLGNNPDYFSLFFDCTKKTDQYYEVVVDQKTNETGFIKKSDTLFKFETVDEYVNEWTAMGLDFDRTENPLRKEPSDHARVIQHPDQKKYKIWRAKKIEMKGDWLKVEISESEQGWIRWRKGDRIVIRLYFAC